MKTISAIAGVALGVLVLFGSFGRAVAATLFVDDFAAGTGEWHTLGTVFDTGEAAILSDQVSSRTALFRSVPILNESVITVEFDFLNGLSDAVPIGGLPDAVFATVYLGTGSFGDNLDTASFDSASPLLDLDASEAVPITGTIADSEAKGLGWSFYSGSLSAPAGEFTLAFEFVDDNGLAGDSSSAFDNIEVGFEIIPEPSAGLLLVAPLFALALRRRRTD